MATSKSSGGKLTQIIGSRSGRLSILLILPVLAVIAAVCVVLSIVPQREGPEAPSDPLVSLQDKTGSENNRPKTSAETENQTGKTTAPATEKHPGETTSSATEKHPGETTSSVTEKLPGETTVPATEKRPEETTTPATEKHPEETTSLVTEKHPGETAAPVTEKRPGETTTPVTEKSPEKTTPSTSVNPPNSPDSAARVLLDRMSLEEKICQLFIVTPEQLGNSSGTVTQATDIMQTALGRHPVGGVIFFAGNIKTPSQITGMIGDLQKASGLGLFVAVDEEGGRVARLGKNPAMETTAFPPMAEIGASGDRSKARNVGLTIGQDLRRFGFNLDFAPVADVNSNPDNPVINDRAFSSDPRIAADMVAACVRGFKESGVLCTLKHFPGHGDTATDSHYGAASSGKTLAELQSCEFLPFEAGIAAGADVVMLGHISLPNVTGNDLPATLSYEITTGILREQLGFEGLIVTDSMSMAAITSHFSSEEAAVKAIQAGADLILMPANLNDAVTGILNAVKTGEISEERLNESVYRILYTKLAQGIIPLS